MWYYVLNVLCAFRESWPQKFVSFSLECVLVIAPASSSPKWANLRRILVESPCIATTPFSKFFQVLPSSSVQPPNDVSNTVLSVSVLPSLQTCKQVAPPEKCPLFRWFAKLLQRPHLKAVCRFVKADRTFLLIRERHQMSKMTFSGPWANDWHLKGMRKARLPTQRHTMSWIQAAQLTAQLSHPSHWVVWGSWTKAGKRKGHSHKGLL